MAIEIEVLGDSQVRVWYGTSYQILKPGKHKVEDGFAAFLLANQHQYPVIRPEAAPYIRKCPGCPRLFSVRALQDAPRVSVNGDVPAGQIMVSWICPGCQVQSEFIIPAPPPPEPVVMIPLLALGNGVLRVNAISTKAYHQGEVFEGDARAIGTAPFIVSAENPAAWDLCANPKCRRAIAVADLRAVGQRLNTPALFAAKRLAVVTAGGAAAFIESGTFLGRDWGAAILARLKQINGNDSIIADPAMAVVRYKCRQCSQVHDYPLPLDEEVSAS